MAFTFRPVAVPTDDELLLLHELNPGYTVERLADGALLVSPNGSRGSLRNTELTRQLGNWAAARGETVFDSSAGFRLPDSAVFAPDGAFVLRSRWDGLTHAQTERYFPGAPDAAFEIVSKTDSREAQLAKCEAYVGHGSALVVLLDPYRNTMDVWRGGAHSATAAPQTLDCAPIMAGCLLNVRAILDA